MDDISALLGLGLDDEMQTQALADSLRGRKRAADFFGMSTIGNVAKAAQSEQGAITDAATRGGVLRKAMADREAMAERESAAQAARASEGLLDREAQATESALDRKSREAIASAKSARGGQASNTADYRSSSFDQGLKNMKAIIAKGYNPAGVEGLKDKLVNKSDWTRWMGSDEGQQFLASANTAREALLRAATGAAAPDAEKIDYMLTLIPQPGESQETVRWKIEQLEERGEFLRQLGGGSIEDQLNAINDEFDNMSDEEIDAELARRGLLP